MFDYYVTFQLFRAGQSVGHGDAFPKMQKRIEEPSDINALKESLLCEAAQQGSTADSVIITFYSFLREGL